VHLVCEKTLALSPEGFGLTVSQCFFRLRNHIDQDGIMGS